MTMLTRPLVPPSVFTVPRTHIRDRRSAARFRLPTLLTWALGGIAAANALVGLAWGGLWRDVPSYAGNARGTGVVMLLVAAPTALFAARAAMRGSLRAQLIWLGALGYLAYNATLFAVSVRFNALFLLYVAMLSLSVWSLVLTIVRVDARRISKSLRVGTPARAIGAYLIGIAILFSLVWLEDVLPALVQGTMPLMLRETGLPTNPVHVLDLAFTLPLTAVAGAWLRSRKPWGIVLSGMMLVMLTIEGVSVAVDQLFGHIADPRQSLVAVPVFAILTIIGLIPTLALLRGVQALEQR